MVGLDLRGELPDVAEPDAELIVARAPLRVLRADLLVAERLQLREGITEDF